MKRIAVFDFDGTLTSKDTLLEFIRFTHGTRALYGGLLLYSPLLVLMKLHFMDNGKIKERVFSHFFKGVGAKQFMSWGRQFYTKAGATLLYKDGIACIKQHKAQGDMVVILSASIRQWVQPFAEALGADVLLSTEVEVVEDKLTGYFSTPNCYGAEKVKRLREWMQREGINSQTPIIAYGDSRGDKELLQIAKEKYYKLFTK